jgi:hypothetical protein
MGPIETLTSHPHWHRLTSEWDAERARISSDLDARLEAASNLEGAEKAILLVSGERRGFDRALRVISSLVRRERRAEEEALRKEPANA